MNNITFNNLLSKIRFLVCLTVVLVAGITNAQVAPITDINGGFGIDGNLRADVPTIGVGDWVDGPNNGGFVLSNTGASVSSGSALLRELYNTQSDSIFTQGSKYLQNPNSWVWTTGKAGGKGDIHNGMYSRGKDGSNNEWIIFGSDRLSTNGTSYIDFELYQSPLSMTAGGGFTSAGPNGGRTVNDILVTIEYGSGGSVANVFFYLWGSNGSGGFTYNLISINNNSDAFGATNMSTITVPFGAFGTNNYTSNQFVEGALNISAIISSSLPDPCQFGALYKTLFIKTKSSTASTAALNDFMRPISVDLTLGTAEIAYLGSPACALDGPLSVTQTGVSGGTYTSAPAGLVINGATGEINVQNSTPGTYTVTYSYFTNGCPKTATTSVTIANNPPAPQANDITECAQNPLQTLNANNAIIPTAGQSVVWYTQAVGGTVVTTPTLNTIGTVDYYAEAVANASGCTSTTRTKVNLRIYANPNVAITSSSDVSCFGGSDGTATAQASQSTNGAPGPFTYSWDTTPVQTSATATNLSAGTYTVTITDSFGCTNATQVTINEPTAGLSESAVVTDVLCFGEATGAIDLTVSGGTSPYTYVWSNGATTEDISDLAAGDYSVVITDANNCTLTSATYTVGQPTAGLSESAVVTDVLCFGEATGAIDLTVSGGTSPYTYVWSNGATTEDISDLAAGDYSVVITDANNCTLTSATYTVGQPTAGLSESAVVTDVLCFGEATGAIDLTVSGGTSPYTYVWSNGATTEDISDLAAGDYSVVITDANNCTLTSATYTVGQPTAGLSESAVVTDVLCFGEATGAIDLTVSGGTSPYTYVWSNGATTEDISDLAAGDYSVVITDANNCTLTSATYTVGQPTAGLSESAVVTDVLCFGEATGAIDLTVSGGTSPYTYVWSNGATTEDISDLAAGDYSVVITDANNCTLTSATYTVGQPTAGLSESAVVTDVLCFGEATGAIDLTVSGGTSPYTYVWSNGATTEDISDLAAGDYSVVITDANNCTLTSATYTVGQPTAGLSESAVVTDVLCFGEATGAIDLTVSGGTSPYTYVWSNGATTEDISDLAAGDYSVVITDANNCTLTSATYTVGQPTAGLSESAVVTDVLCFGEATGAIDLTVSGGTSPYTYVWSNGATTEDISDLAAGDYSVVITDANNCTLTSATYTVGQPTAGLSESAVVTDVLCFGEATGAIDLTVSGGTSPYTYVWSNGATTEDISDLAAGDYSVVITDANNCTLTSATYTVGQPTAGLSESAVVTDVLCFGEATGAIDLTVSGGTSPYTYVWSNGATTEDISDLAAGDYSVVITDANNCTLTSATYTVGQPTAGLSESAVVTDVLCFGEATGAIDLTVSGGTSPYTYVWSNGATTEDISDLAAGDYSVVITDANNCTLTSATYTVGQPTAGLSESAVVTDVLCLVRLPVPSTLRSLVGQVLIPMYGATVRLTEDISDLATGDYSVVITDARIIICGQLLPIRWDNQLRSQ